MEKNTEKQRVHLQMPKYMVDELDVIADELGANRTALINMVIRQYLDQREVVNMTKMIQQFDNRDMEEIRSKINSQGI